MKKEAKRGNKEEEEEGSGRHGHERRLTTRINPPLLTLLVQDETPPAEYFSIAVTFSAHFCKNLFIGRAQPAVRVSDAFVE